jgi:hypothetical protein
MERFLLVLGPLAGALVAGLINTWQGRSQRNAAFGKELFDLRRQLYTELVASARDARTFARGALSPFNPIGATLEGAMAHFLDFRRRMPEVQLVGSPRLRARLLELEHEVNEVGALLAGRVDAADIRWDDMRTRLDEAAARFLESARHDLGIEC